MEGKSKYDLICNKDIRKIKIFMMEKYLENCRLEVLWLTNMIETRTTMKCKNQEPRPGVGVLESPLHLMSCKAYEEFRQGIDPELNQKERPGYLGKIIAGRKVLESKLIK